jgi:hypothetical protein
VLETFITLRHAVLACRDPRTFGFVLQAMELGYLKAMLAQALDERAAKEESQREKAGEPATLEDAWL